MMPLAPASDITARRPSRAKPVGGRPGELAYHRVGLVEDQVLLAREVVGDRHLGHPGGLGDLRDRDLAEAALGEQPGSDGRDRGPGLQLVLFTETG